MSDSVFKLSYGCSGYSRFVILETEVKDIHIDSLVLDVVHRLVSCYNRDFLSLS